MNQPSFILGSSSPRRKQLLAQIGIEPDTIVAADIDETPRKGELPRDYVDRMALEKAQEVVKSHAGSIILAADTTVVMGRRIFGKPESRDEARAFLNLFSGRRHRVLTSVAVVHPNGEIRVKRVETVVRFKRIGKAEMEAYLDSKEWEGKAGGYAIHGLAGALIPWINGSFTAVMGLPVAETKQMLEAAGLK